MGYPRISVRSQLRTLDGMIKSEMHVMSIYEVTAWSDRYELSTCLAALWHLCRRGAVVKVWNGKWVITEAGRVWWSIEQGRKVRRRR